MTDISSIGGTVGNSVLSTQGGTFGDNPFLSMLVAQMRSQTPLQPVDDASFMQQMAQFSSMEEQKQLNDNLLRLLDFQGALARLQGLGEGSALLGKEVTYNVGDQERTGTVSSVFVNDQGEVLLNVGEDEVSLRSVTGIRTKPTE